MSKNSLNSMKAQVCDLQTTYILGSAIVAYSKLLMIRATDDVILCYGLSMCYVMYDRPYTAMGSKKFRNCIVNFIIF